MTLPISLYEETSRINKINLAALYRYSNGKDDYTPEDDGL